MTLLSGATGPRRPGRLPFGDDRPGSADATTGRIGVPPIKTQGIKTKLLPFIRRNIEWSEEGRWIEPFLGSGVVALTINPARALLGDTNIHLIHFYRRIQDGSLTSQSVRCFLEREGSVLARRGEEHYYRVRERFNDNEDSHDFLFLNRSCFNGLMRFNRHGNFNTPFCRKPMRFTTGYITRICNQVQWAADRICGRPWEFVCADWSALLDEAVAEDFVYADPPYAGRFADYFNGWTDEDAARLDSVVKALPCPFLYSMWAGNKYRKNTRLYRTFCDYRIETFSHFFHLGASERLRNAMTEALVVG